MKIYLKYDAHVLIYNKMSTSEWEKEKTEYTANKYST